MPSAAASSTSTSTRPYQHYQQHHWNRLMFSCAHSNFMNRQRRQQSTSGGGGGGGDDSTLFGSPTPLCRMRRPGCPTATHFVLLLLIFMLNRSPISNNLVNFNSYTITLTASSPSTSSSTAAASLSSLPSSSGISGFFPFAMAFQSHTVTRRRQKSTTAIIGTSSSTSSLFSTYRQRRRCDHLPLAADRHDYNLSRLEGRIGRGRHYYNRAITTVAITTTRSHTALFSKLNNDASEDDDGKDDVDGDGGEHGDDDNIPATISTSSSSSSIFQRFLNPRIDDPGLLLSDALFAQIVAPTLQIYWLLLVNGPSPSWLHPITGGVSSSTTTSLYGAFSSRGTLLAPTLVHGAGLAVCWLAGALAARMFEREAFTLQSTTTMTTKELERSDAKKSIDVTDSTINIIRSYQPILTRLVQAGAFSSGMLILATQFDLLLEFRGNIVTVGMSDEIDFRLLLATVEVINDIVWEGLVISAWRVWHATFMSNEENRWKRF